MKRSSNRGSARIELGKASKVTLGGKAGIFEVGGLYTPAIQLS